MKKTYLISLATLLSVLMLSDGCNGGVNVVTYTSPGKDPVTDEYSVRVNGKPADVYLALTQHHDEKYYFSYFDFTGEIKVEITSKSDLKNVKILPESCGIKPDNVSGKALTFSTGRPFRISIERNGENSPLLLFGNEIEKETPDLKDPSVIYFGPGIHKPGKILLRRNQTLYLSGGAVVSGGVEAEGENIKILGRGILDGTDYAHQQGPAVFMIHLEKCRNVVIRDIILRGSWGYTIAPCGSDSVLIENVKICGSRVSNDDGIDPINSSNLVVSNCFVRTDDDCIAIKGHKGYNRKNSEKIIVKDCSLWTDRANIFRIGYESETGGMQDITAQNIDVLHIVDNRQPEEFWANCIFYIQPSDNMPMSRLRFENIRINASDGNNLILKMMPMICRGMGDLETKRNTGKFYSWDYLLPGRFVEDCTFKDIILSGTPAKGQGIIYIAGADTAHVVRNIRFENIVRFGLKTFADSPDVFIGPYAYNITFH